MSRALILGLVAFILVSTSAIGFTQERIDLDKGKTDLLKNEGLSQPFTVLDQLLYSLQKEADADAKYFRPEDDDFRIGSGDSWGATASVAYDRGLLRVGVAFAVTVTGMNDPWREVCKKHVKEMAVILGVLLPHGEQASSDMGKTLLRVTAARYLGPMAQSGQVPITSLRDFFDSIVVTGRFPVSGRNGKGLRYLRQCWLDTRSGRMSYYEHRY